MRRRLILGAVFMALLVLAALGLVLRAGRTAGA
jgi:hypothetical protein